MHFLNSEIKIHIMKVILNVAFFMLFFTKLFSQVLDDAAISSREKAETLIKNDLHDELKGRSYALFSVADKDYIIIVEHDEYYIEYFFNSTLKVSEDTVSNNSITKAIFNKKNYRKDFTSFNSEFYKSGYKVSNGNITYFVFKDEKGKRYGEARLSIIIDPNPIDARIYLYFVDKYFSYKDDR